MYNPQKSLFKISADGDVIDILKLHLIHVKRQLGFISNLLGEPINQLVFCIFLFSQIPDEELLELTAFHLLPFVYSSSATIDNNFGIKHAEKFDYLINNVLKCDSKFLLLEVRLKTFLKCNHSHVRSKEHVYQQPHPGCSYSVFVKKALAHNNENNSPFTPCCFKIFF